jgi:hypothetical protein
VIGPADLLPRNKTLKHRGTEEAEDGKCPAWEGSKCFLPSDEYQSTVFKFGSSLIPLLPPFLCVSGFTGGQNRERLSEIQQNCANIG